MLKNDTILQFYKTSSLKKRRNVFTHLLAREYDEKYSHNRIHHITGTLITKGDCHLERVWTHASPQRICCDGRFAFFNNYQEIFDCGQYSCKGKPKPKFKLRSDKHDKILDGVLMDSPSESVSLPHSGHCASFFAVTKNCHLLRVDLQTGKLLQKVSLGSPAVRFQKISWNRTDESLVVSSVLYPRQPLHFMRQAGLEITDVIQLIVMSCMPLEFVCKLSVTKQVFGKQAEDASISLDLLMVMHSSGHIRMYSFQALLQESITHRHQLYNTMPDGATFGVDCPLSHNIEFQECPPCLLEVRCRNRDVMITSPPCHYIMWPVEKSSGYCCYSVRTRQMIQNGCLVADEMSLEEKVGLHADDSGRIIQVMNSQLRMFKLLPIDDRSEDRALVKDFVIDCNSSAKPKSPSLSVSLSGRVIKKRVFQGISDIPEQTVLSLMYSQELDMIIILSLKAAGFLVEEGTQTTMVGFYDNWNGKLLREFKLEDAPSEEVEERFFGYDCDTVTHVFKNLKKKMECHVYKLTMSRQGGSDDIPMIKTRQPKQQRISRRTSSQSLR